MLKVQLIKVGRHYQHIHERVGRKDELCIIGIVSLHASKPSSISYISTHAEVFSEYTKTSVRCRYLHLVRSLSYHADIVWPVTMVILGLLCWRDVPQASIIRKEQGSCESSSSLA